MAQIFPRGRICWNELVTTDPQAAVGFYKAVVGWETQPWGDDASYVLWIARGARVGGLMALPEEARQMGSPPTWVMYVAVPDVDATVRQAESLGARTYVEPQDIPTMGRFAVLGDPHGATFALFTSTTEIPGHDGPATAGEFSWHELATSDWGAAWDFYEQLFGWVKMDAMDMGPMGTYQTFGRAGQMIGGMYNKPPEMQAPPHWLCYALVPSADAAAAVVPRLGGKVLNGPLDVPGGGRITQCLDPQGAAFAVLSNAVEDTAPQTPRPRATPEKPATKANKQAAAKTKAVRKKASSKKKTTKKKAAKQKTARKSAKKPRAGGKKAKRPAARRRRR